MPFAPSRSPEGKEEVPCADALGIERPYLLVDVEVGMRFRAARCGESVRNSAHCLADTAGGGESCAVTREELAEAAGEVWSSIFRFNGEEPEFPAFLDGSNARPALGRAQLEDKELAPLVTQLREGMKTKWAKRKDRDVKVVAGKRASPLEIARYRLNPDDGLLERRVVFCEGAYDLPVIPQGVVNADAEGRTWRRWLFEHAHASFLSPHRSQGESFQLLRRMGWWATLSTDFNTWYANCLVCRQHRARPVQGPFRSTTADDSRQGAPPWTDVMIDVQGPYTRAEGGEQYVLSYLCTALKVPLMEPFKTLQAGSFSRALVSVIMKSRTIPDIMRSDQGAEMTSRVNAEFLALCGTLHRTGSAFTPRHQGLVERSHQVQLQQHLIMMNAVCHAFPQEWPAMVPVLEYLYMTAPRGSSGLSAHDITAGYALLTPDERRLAPFRVPHGAPETAVAAKLFQNFAELYQVFARTSAEEAMKAQDELNRKRNLRIFDRGEIVFRRMPAFARPAKHLM